jgi:site-specific DNA-methyltransferase (adenine-specific)
MSIHTDKRKVLFTSNHTEWETPLWFFKVLDKQYNFEWDMAASKENALCKKFVTAKEDALSIEWPGNSSIFVNFPYNSKIIPRWMERGWDAAKRKSTVVFLAHARTDTIWYHKWAILGLPIFVKGRLKFLYKGVEQGPAPFPSLIVVYKPADLYFGDMHKEYETMSGKIEDHIKFFQRPIKRYPR